jgi:glutaredoxin
MVKDFLTENKIKFKEIDVGKDRKAAIEMVNKSGQTGVPVIDIDGTIIIGFDRDAIKKVLKIK